MAVQIWKKPFRKNGYPAETVEISTVGKVKGDYIVLPRKYFQLNGTSAQFFDSKTNTYKPASIGATSNSFLIAKTSDAELSNTLSLTVFTRIQLNNNNVVGTKLLITYQPFGDILDPADFEQPLDTKANVKHKSLTLTGDLTCDNVVALKDITAKKVIADKGEFQQVVSPSVKTNKLTLDGTEISYENGLFKLGAKKIVPVLDQSNVSQQKASCLLSVSGVSPTELEPISWLKIHPGKQDLEIQNTNILETINDLKARIKKLEEGK